ncbi:uncharacterized protein LOC130787880 [Actinidia eriantha]|uniref:uncharacterized protein LOC130787880 n=1 Tax=Actinidia eriantha TaxID=165200 RepID=UPI0025848174|nr:uncharacterized protein LOC130787880 [Actinidia eriantha]
MAPRKRRSDEEEPEPELKPKPNTRSRRSTANSIAQSEPEEVHNLKRKKKLKSETVPTSENVVVDHHCHTNKTIVIEHCKQCNAFKTRAIQVKNGLENDVSGITVLVNPEKPRRGCFEIREEGGEKFISLLDMKRPFAPMKALDMDKVISDVIDKIK